MILITDGDLSMTGGLNPGRTFCTFSNTLNGDGKSHNEHYIIRHHWSNHESRSDLLDLLLFILPYLFRQVRYELEITIYKED